MHGLKYQGHTANARELVAIARGHFDPAPGHAEALLVPVPVHSTRRRDRGYNQAELLAKEWCRLSGHAVAAHLLERTRATRTQTRLDALERSRNLHGAFRAAPGAAGRHIVLVDDVLTTGATLTACAAALLCAGAASVEAWTVLWAGEA